MISLSDLEGMGPGDEFYDSPDEKTIREALPVLLEIARAALAWQDQRGLNLMDYLAKTDEEIEAEPLNVSHERRVRTLELARALGRALAKVSL